MRSWRTQFGASFRQFGRPVARFGMRFGKMPQPWFKASGWFFDNDINPEGIAAKFGTGPFFASAFGFYLSERSTASDASLIGGQTTVVCNWFVHQQFVRCD
mgnify:CR=1 FL=1